MTKTPIGLVKPFRAIGGKFSIWWPAFLGRMHAWVNDAMRHGSHNFIFVTYHFSASDTHLGCAGWKYDTAAARAHAQQLAQDLSFVFGEQLTAIVAGVETDRDMLVLHGTQDITGEQLIGKSSEEVDVTLAQAFPSMHPEVRADLIPFLLGNARRVEELTKTPHTPEAMEHNERIIAVGKGFDWLAEKNLALIINDADPNLAESIRVAANIIQKNLQSAPTGDDATLFTNIIYHQPGVDQRQAIARSKGLLAFAKKTLAESHPDLIKSGRLHAMCGVLWEPAKKLETLITE